jgi:hypothetical protein
MMAEWISCRRSIRRGANGVKTRCGVCGRSLESFETIHVAEQGPRCYPCFNHEIAERMGVKFDNAKFQPIVVADPDGVSHTFDIQSMLVGTGHEMIAREIVNGDRPGYHFAVLGDFEADAWQLFQRLYARVREEMAKRHVHRTEFGWQLTDEHRVVGRIEWDPDSEGRLPLIVIDGKPFTWEQVGHMLMTYEGFTLEARIKDTIEVLDEEDRE